MIKDQKKSQESPNKRENLCDLDSDGSKSPKTVPLSALLCVTVVTVG